MCGIRVVGPFNRFGMGTDTSLRLHYRPAVPTAKVCLITVMSDPVNNIIIARAQQCIQDMACAARQKHIQSMPTDLYIRWFFTHPMSDER